MLFRSDQRAVVQPGVINLQLSREAMPLGYYYAPDPSSQQVCSIGGNVAENSGGAHCLKYGFTTNHVLGVELVTPDGEVVELGGKKQKVQTASAVLCYSRMLYFQCFPTFQRFDCKVFLTDAVRYFGGATERVMIDNTHVVVWRGTGREMIDRKSVV